MPTKLTLEQMEELLAIHEMAEFNLDIDATMATLVENPIYELPALNWHIEGQDAVRETYRRLLHGGDVRNMWAEKRTHAIADGSLCREAYVYVDTDEGVRVTGRYNVVMDFEGDKIAGERMFMDATFAKAMAEILGPDFGDVPGVSPLDEKSPPPVPRLDRAAVHAANSNH
ncbi:nuclear transport factor 2-like protein [Mycobacterium sp. MUNTM1]